jgi:hypothetical protein
MRLARSLEITGAVAAKHAQHVRVTGSLDNGLNLVADPFETDDAVEWDKEVRWPAPSAKRPRKFGVHDAVLVLTAPSPPVKPRASQQGGKNVEVG